MGTILKLKDLQTRRRVSTQQNSRQETAVRKKQGMAGHQDLHLVLLAIAFHSRRGSRNDARRLLNYISAHDPLPDPMFLPEDLHELVAETDFGATMFPSVPEAEQ